MLLKSNKPINCKKGTLLLTDIRDLDNKFYFSITANRYLHKLYECKNIKANKINYGKNVILFPDLSCSCNNFKPSELILDNFCIHIRKKILFSFKEKLLPLSFLLLSDYRNDTEIYEFCNPNFFNIYIALYPYKKFVSIYYADNKLQYKKIKYYPFKSAFEFGITLDNNLNTYYFIKSVIKEVKIITDVVKEV